MTSPTATPPPSIRPCTTAVNPGAAAWFKSSAQHLLVRIDGYLAVLNDHHVAWVRLAERTAPGRVVYEDDHQVVVVPIQEAAGAADVPQRGTAALRPEPDRKEPIQIA
jgi:hypothetical protein